MKTKLRLFLACAFLLLFSSLPTWSGYLAQTPQQRFAGTYFDAPDYAVHLAMLRAGMRGETAYTFKFTSEAHSPGFTRLFYLALGALNRPFKLPPRLVFELARWFWGFAALLSLFALLRRWLPQESALWNAFWLAVGASGLGWLQALLGWIPGPISPIDFWLIDAYLLFSLSLFPHFAFTLSALFLSLLQFDAYLRDSRPWRLALIVALAALTQFVNPIIFVCADAALAGMALSQLRQKPWLLAVLLLLAAAQLPLLVYNWQLLTADPVWRQFTLQNETLSPPPVYYLWGFGLLWPLAAWGLRPAWQQNRPAAWGLGLWLLTAFGLAYAPFAIQRRFLLGITLPLAFFAALGLENLPRLLRRQRVWLLGLTVFSTLLFFPLSAASMLKRPAAFFYPAALEQASQWLLANASPAQLILTSERSAQILAQESGLRVYAGHEMETLHYHEKQTVVKTFFESGALPAGVDWIFYGPEEKRNWPHFAPPPGWGCAAQGADWCLLAQLP